LELLSKGCSDKEVAAALRVTTFTVNKHVGAILLKMNVRSRTAAAVHAIREHLFDDPPRVKALKPTA
jgi:DNA-binding NarL/FixJ family response regulator